LEFRRITAKETEDAIVLELAGYPADEAADLAGMQFRQKSVSDCHGAPHSPLLRRASTGTFHSAAGTPLMNTTTFLGAHAMAVLTYNCAPFICRS
jgi:hypothetical protein